MMEIKDEMEKRKNFEMKEIFEKQKCFANGMFVGFCCCFFVSSRKKIIKYC